MMIWLTIFLVATCCSTASGSFGWGLGCSYTPEPQISTVSVLSNQEQFISTIPSGKGEVFFELSATADLDTKLVAADGTVLLAYDLSTDEWIGGCYDCPGTQTFTYHGMKFETCVDSCDVDVTLTNREGSSFFFEGNPDYAHEWVRINQTTEEIHLSVVGYDSGDGSLEWLWDCPAECASCFPLTPEPSLIPSPNPTPAPSLLPSSSHLPSPQPSQTPSLNPTPNPTTTPTPRPSYTPTSVPSPLPTSTPTPLPIPVPTSPPSSSPTSLPTLPPTLAPSAIPSLEPSLPPSQLPSPVPTVFPTVSPSSSPTMIPTRFQCNVNDNGDFDPTPYLALGKSDITVSSGSAFALDGVLQNGTSSSRRFGFFSGATPGSTFSFEASLADGAVVISGSGEGNSGSTIKETVERIEVVLKTATVYWDEPSMEVSYQVFDAVGRTVVLISSLSVTLELSLESDSPATASTTCELPSSTSGVGLCRHEVSSSWFSPNSTRMAAFVVRVGQTTTSAPAESLFLNRKPTFHSLSDAGMYATFPQHPLLALDYLDAPVFAHTGGQDLSVWVLEVAYDTSVLEYVSMTTSSSYTSAVVTTGTGSLSMSTSGLRNGVSTSSVTGTDVSIARLRFRVVNSVIVSTHSDAFSFTVTQMVNQYSIGFASDLAGQVNDERGGALSSGQLTVSTLSYVGIWAYSSLNDIVNTAPLTGASVSTTLEAVAVYNWAGYSDSSVSSSVSCSFASNVSFLVADVSGCVVTFGSYHESGSSGLAVTVEMGDLVTSALFRVWFPVSVSLVAQDTNLGLVLPGRGDVQAVRDSYAINGNRYQETKLSAMATFVATVAPFDLTSANVTVDVSDMMTYASSNMNVAVVAGRILRGISAGTVSIGFSLPNPEHVSGSLASILVIVSEDSPAFVKKLSVAVLSGAKWTSSLGSVGVTGTSVEPIIQLEHILTAEGDTAMVMAYAEFDDNTVEDVSSELVLSSTNAYVGVTNSPPSVLVKAGALKLCSPALMVTWNVHNSATLASNRAVIMLNMPDAVTVVITPSTAKISKVGDGSTSSPFSIASSIFLSVVITFEDATTQDYSLDSRTRYRIADDGSQQMVSVAGNVVTVLPNAVLNGISRTVSVHVDFPGVNELNGTTSVLVVELSSVAINTVPYPSVNGWSSGDVSVLKYISCSGIHQRLEARATGVLSDGTIDASSNFYSRVSYTSSSVPVAAFVSAPCAHSICRGLVPSSAGGQLTINATFGGLSSSMTITVSFSTVAVVGLSVKNNIGTSSTLSGVVGTTDSIVTTVAFDDGTTVEVASSGSTSSSWLAPSRFLNFSTNMPNAIAVNSEGVVSLVTNYYEAIVVTVRDSCEGGNSATRSVFANLQPEVYDVDLGSKTGATFGTVVAGATFSIPVRIQGASSRDVTAFQIRVTFDAAKVVVVSDASCEQGSGWLSSFECTTNDPVDEVLLIGSCGLNPSSGCSSKGLTEVAIITFTAVASGVVDIGGEIVKVKDDTHTITGASIFAGADVAVITTTRRRGLAENFDSLKTATDSTHSVVPGKLEIERDLSDELRTQAKDIYDERSLLIDTRISLDRRLSMPCSELVGDTNGDCVFDVEDVQYLQYYIGGAVDVNTLSAQQLSAMDADLDNDSDGVDIAFMMKVVANKYRFLGAFSASSDPFGLNVTTLLASSEPAGSSSTTVSFEIGTNLNKGSDLHLALGTNQMDTSDGVYAVGEEDSTIAPGVHRVLADAVSNSEQDVGVVVMISTLDANGATDSGREFAYYCTRIFSSCVSVYGDSSSAFKPFTYVDIEQSTRVPTQIPSAKPTALPTRLPRAAPSGVPSLLPSILPSYVPSPLPTPISTPLPTNAPTLTPSPLPSLNPSPGPSPTPTIEPSQSPSAIPTPQPSLAPSPVPTSQPSQTPSSIPSPLPSTVPTPQPTLTPSLIPSPLPKPVPSPQPSQTPSSIPSPLPTPVPTPQPTQLPTPQPTPQPTSLPLPVPTPQPSPTPSSIPSTLPTIVPTPQPSQVPSLIPSLLPSTVPTPQPSQTPSSLPSIIPTPVPIPQPSQTPSSVPSIVPTPEPTPQPSPTPSSTPSSLPSAAPTPQPTQIPSLIPTPLPTPVPTTQPTQVPSSIPSPLPSTVPTPQPSPTPSSIPSIKPTPVPNPQPTQAPSLTPSPLPTPVPTTQPSQTPSSIPSIKPTPVPTPQPTQAPSLTPSPLPTPVPTTKPSQTPSSIPSTVPTPLPTPRPTQTPSLIPTSLPTHAPTPQPTQVPSSVPSPLPSTVPTPQPSQTPSSIPSTVPIPVPTPQPTQAPSLIPSTVPTPVPTPQPSQTPSPIPSTVPIPVPTTQPSPTPSPIPSTVPTLVPTPQPSQVPSLVPSPLPTDTTPLPTLQPSDTPSASPSPQPSLSFHPTFSPSIPPTPGPTLTPTVTSFPTRLPTPIPTSLPSSQFPSPTPSLRPSQVPTFAPSISPSVPPTPPPTSLPTSPPSALPSSLPSLLPSSVPTSKPSPTPTLSPTLKPYALVSASFLITLPGFENTAAFSRVAKGMFRSTVVAVAPDLTSPGQIMNVNASNLDAPAPVRQRSRRLRSSNGGVEVSFLLQMDMRVLPAAFAPAIEGPVSDDSWTRSNESLALATGIFQGIRDDIAVSFSPTVSGGASTWAVAAEKTVSSVSARLQTAGILERITATDSSQVSVDLGSVSIKVCRWDEPCFAPSPEPTMSFPSQSPTLKPSSLQVLPMYRSNLIHSAAASFVFLAALQVLVCYALAHYHGKNSVAKRRKREERALEQEIDSFASAHIIDLFGGSGLFVGSPAFAHARDRKQRQPTALETGLFTDETVKAMFVGLDEDSDGLVTKRDIEVWVKSQRAGSIGCDLQVDEVDGLLRQGIPSIAALKSSAIFSTSARNLLNRLETDIPNGVGGVAVREETPKALASLFDAEFRQGASECHTKTAGRGLESDLSALHGCGDSDDEDEDSSRSRTRKDEPCLTEAGLQACLARFPMLAFDWDAPLTRPVTREKASAIFRRLDTDGDGWVHPSDLRVWRRMLPLGRSADALVLAVLMGAKKTTTSAGVAQGASERDRISSEKQRGRVGGGASEMTADPKARKAAQQEELGIRSSDLFLVLRADSLLGAEFTAQCDLLDFILGGGIHGSDESHPHDNGDVGSVFSPPVTSTPLRRYSEAMEKPQKKYGNHYLHGDEAPFSDTFEHPGVDDSMATDLEGSFDLDRYLSPQEHRGNNRKPLTPGAVNAFGQLSSATFSPAAARGRVPDEVAVSAFVCVAKLKLLRLAAAQHEVDTREDTVAGEVFSAIARHSALHRKEVKDEEREAQQQQQQQRGAQQESSGCSGCGGGGSSNKVRIRTFVTTQDVERFLQQRAGLTAGVGKAELALIFGHEQKHEEESENGGGGNERVQVMARGKAGVSSPHLFSGTSSPFSDCPLASPSRTSCGFGGIPFRSFTGREGKRIDRAALRGVFSHPSHRTMVTLLHTFVVADATMQENKEILCVGDNLETEGEEGDEIVVDPSFGTFELRGINNSTEVNPRVGTSALIKPRRPVAAFSKATKLPPAMNPAQVKSLFSAIDTDGDGYVTPSDLRLWLLAAGAGCGMTSSSSPSVSSSVSSSNTDIVSGVLVSGEDIDALFHPQTPSFLTAPRLSVYPPNGSKQSKSSDVSSRRSGNNKNNSADANSKTVTTTAVVAASAGSRSTKGISIVRAINNAADVDIEAGLSFDGKISGPRQEVDFGGVGTPHGGVGIHLLDSLVLTGSRSTSADKTARDDHPPALAHVEQPTKPISMTTKSSVGVAAAAAAAAATFSSSAPLPLVVAIEGRRHSSIIKSSSVHSPVAGGISLHALNHSLARRPLLSARLGLLHFQALAADATAHADAVAREAAFASAAAASAAAALREVAGGSPPKLPEELAEADKAAAAAAGAATTGRGRISSTGSMVGFVLGGGGGGDGGNSGFGGGAGVDRSFRRSLSRAFEFVTSPRARAGGGASAEAAAAAAAAAAEAEERRRRLNSLRVEYEFKLERFRLLESLCLRAEAASEGSQRNAFEADQEAKRWLLLLEGERGFRRRRWAKDDERRRRHGRIGGGAPRGGGSGQGGEGCSGSLGGAAGTTNPEAKEAARGVGGGGASPESEERRQEPERGNAKAQHCMDESPRVVAVLEKLRRCEEEDRYGIATARLRRKLKDLRSRGRRHGLAVLQVSTGLECRLLELRESEQWPKAVAAVANLRPLPFGVSRAAVQLQRQLQAQENDLKANQEEEVEEKGKEEAAGCAFPVTPTKMKKKNKLRTRKETLMAEQLSATKRDVTRSLGKGKKPFAGKDGEVQDTGSSNDDDSDDSGKDVSRFDPSIDNIVSFDKWKERGGSCGGGEKEEEEDMNKRKERRCVRRQLNEAINDLALAKAAAQRAAFQPLPTPPKVSGGSRVAFEPLSTPPKISGGSGSRGSGSSGSGIVGSSQHEKQELLVTRATNDSDDEELRILSALSTPLSPSTSAPATPLLLSSSLLFVTNDGAIDCAAAAAEEKEEEEEQRVPSAPSAPSTPLPSSTSAPTTPLLLTSSPLFETNDDVYLDGDGGGGSENGERALGALTDQVGCGEGRGGGGGGGGSAGDEDSCHAPPSRRQAGGWRSSSASPLKALSSSLNSASKSLQARSPFKTQRRRSEDREKKKGAELQPRGTRRGSLDSTPASSQPPPPRAPLLPRPSGRRPLTALDDSALFSRATSVPKRPSGKQPLARQPPPLLKRSDSNSSERSRSRGRVNADVNGGDKRPTSKMGSRQEKSAKKALRGSGQSQHHRPSASSNHRAPVKRTSSSSRSQHDAAAGDTGLDGVASGGGGGRSGDQGAGITGGRVGGASARVSVVGRDFEHSGELESFVESTMFAWGFRGGAASGGAVGAIRDSSVGVVNERTLSTAKGVGGGRGRGLPAPTRQKYANDENSAPSPEEKVSQFRGRYSI